jgi:hypothetical protein
MANDISYIDPEAAEQEIRRLNELALTLPGAIPMEDGTWLTFIEFYNDSTKKDGKDTTIIAADGTEKRILDMSGRERLEMWSRQYKKRKGIR